MKPNILITIGDPAGVGPEVTLKALEDQEIRELANWRIVGDAGVLHAAARALGLGSVRTPIIDLGLLNGHEVRLGTLSADCGRAAVGYVKHAAELCVSGEADAMVTAPLNKESVSMSGLTFSGHTEYIAEVTQAKESRMLLVSQRLRVVHVTTHVSLRKACDSTQERILRTIELGEEALQWIGTPQRRIAVCGLNPHAGEHGLFGTEDQETIAPAIAQARAKGIDCYGPMPADTVFLKAFRGEFELVVAMYHDQGHIPIKLVDFEATVNVSLGLPIIRTSVDHGTAFDIAGQGIADETNMKAAMRLASVMAANRVTA
jgi:4-hydroxythreonine-4-phosphate dehydrogenase